MFQEFQIVELPIKNHISGVYIIRNLVNNKVYIGQSKSCTIRWRSHRSELKGNYHSNTYLQASYNKYGLEAFEYSILEPCSSDVIDERERYWIKFYDSTNRDFGYNRESGGHKNKKHSEESKQKMKEASKNENHYPPPSRKGIKWSEEHKKRVSELLKGKPQKKRSEETKQKIRESRLGKALSSQAKEKLSNALLGNKNSLGYVQSEETKKKKLESFRKTIALRKQKNLKTLKLKVFNFKGGILLWLIQLQVQCGTYQTIQVNYLQVI